MTLQNPSLVLNFIDESSTITATTADLIKNSFIWKEQLLNGLKSSSNQVQLELAEDCAAIEYILRTQGDIKATLKDGNTTLFTGYLSDSYKWTITDTGEQALSVIIEDVGTKLLGKTFLNNSINSEWIFDDYINQSSAHSVVKEVCDACGITLDTNAPTISVKVVRSIDRDTTCKEILETMLFEVGYAYYFTSEGKLSLYEINCTSTTGIPKLDSTSLYVVDGNAITLTKKVKQIKQANITWNSLEYRNDVRVYEDISGQSSTYPHCNISIPVGGAYPDEDGNISKTEAADLEKGNELVYISNVTPDISVVQGQYTSTVAQVGSKAIGVLITNTGINTVEVRKLLATADICAVKANNVTIQGQTVASDESKNIYTYEAEYIHDSDSAKKLANLVINYYKYCNYTYVFYSKTNLSSGSLVEINDDTYSGLDVNVLIIGKSYNDQTDIIQYTAVAISPFNLSSIVFTDSTIVAPTVIPGTPGEPGEPGEAAKVFSLSLKSNTYYINKRYSGSQTIRAIADIQGYTLSSGPTLTSSVGTVTAVETNVWDISIPYSTSATSVTITLSAISGSTSLSAQRTASGVDITEYGHNFGAVSAVPVSYTDIYGNTCGIMAGDYFLAAADFSGYSAGIPYLYNGITWAIMAATAANAQRLLNSLGDVLNNTNITVPVTSALYGWLENLVAQNAVIQNLGAQELTILDNGSIHSSYYDASGEPAESVLNVAISNTGSFTTTINSEIWFEEGSTTDGTYTWEMDDSNWWMPVSGNPLSGTEDVSDYGIQITGTPVKYNTITVTVATNIGKGFYLGADGTLKCVSAEAENLAISGNSAFHGVFDCEVIKTEAENPSSYYDTTNGTTADGAQAKRIVDQLILQGIVKDYSTTYTSSAFIPASIKGVSSSVAYIKVNTQKNSAGTTYDAAILFYDSAFNLVDLRNIVGCTTTGGGNSTSFLYSYNTNHSSYWTAQYATGGINLRIYTGQNRLWVDVPAASAASVLKSGMLFRSNTATTVDGVSCYQLYVKA